MRKIKLTKYLFTIGAILLLFVLVRPVLAQGGSGAIWTTNGDCGNETQDVNHFDKGEDVYINGDNFAAGDYDWYIEGKPGGASDDPNIKVASGTFTVGGTGAFCFQAYIVQDDDGGEYSVKFGNKNDNYRVERDQASVLINVGSCVWNDNLQSSSTDVTITITGTTLTIEGVGTFTSSTTINLSPGTYDYTWEALAGYTGKGSGSFTVIDCEPNIASASVNVGACAWDQTNGSLTPVTITINNASLTIDGVGTYTSTTIVDLPPGTYNYTWVGVGDYEGDGGGSFTVYDCSPESAYGSVEVGACVWTEGDGSLTPVTISVTNASLTIDGETYTKSTTIDLPPGTYAYYWEADPNYQGEGSGEIVVEDCTPDAASASVGVGACVWTELDGSLTPVTITLSNASLTIDDETYTESTTIDLPPGTYPYTWEADPGYRGSGSGSITVYDCSPESAYASVQVGACVYNAQSGSKTPVTITLTNASLTINSQTYTEYYNHQSSPRRICLLLGSGPQFPG